MLAGRSGLGLGALLAWGGSSTRAGAGPAGPQGPAAWARGQGLGGLAHNWICGVRNQFEIRYRGGHLLRLGVSVLGGDTRPDD